MASLLNQGTRATQLGENHIVDFSVNGKNVAEYVSRSVSIPAGGMLLDCANGMDDTNWVAREGRHSVTTSIDAGSTPDLIAHHNTCEGTLVVPHGKIVQTKRLTILR